VWRVALGFVWLASCYPPDGDVRRSDPTLMDGGAEPDGGQDARELDTDPFPDANPDVPGADGPADQAGADAPRDQAQPADASQDAAPDTARDMPAEAPPHFDRHCAEYAQNFCARYLACASYRVNQLFGTVERCRARVKISCDNLDLPSSNWPSAACAEGYKTISCDNFRNNFDPVACLTQGSLRNGDTCADETQCESRRCVTPAGKRCGRCDARRLMGEPCLSDGSCLPGLVCPPPNTKRLCVVPGTLGAACDPDHPCQVQLTCRDSKCEALGGEGTPCRDPTTGHFDCDVFAGLGCNYNPGTGQGVCRHFTVEANTCRTMADGTFEICADSGFCSPGSRTCVFAAEDGEACAEDGPLCRPPALCIENKCQVLDARKACP
jgi:hypothetical protein